MNLFNSLFGPLTREYCFYYYGFSVFFYIVFVFVTLFSLYSLLTKKFSFGLLLGLFMGCFTYFLAYFVSRLSYSMCVGSLAPSSSSSPLHFFD